MVLFHQKDCNKTAEIFQQYRKQDLALLKRFANSSSGKTAQEL